MHLAPDLDALRDLGEVQVPRPVVTMGHHHDVAGTAIAFPSTTIGVAAAEDTDHRPRTGGPDPSVGGRGEVDGPRGVMHGTAWVVGAGSRASHGVAAGEGHPVGVCGDRLRVLCAERRSEEHDRQRGSHDEQPEVPASENHGRLHGSGIGVDRAGLDRSGCSHGTRRYSSAVLGGTRDARWPAMDAR